MVISVMSSMSETPMKLIVRYSPLLIQNGPVKKEPRIDRVVCRESMAVANSNVAPRIYHRT